MTDTALGEDPARSAEILESAVRAVHAPTTTATIAAVAHAIRIPAFRPTPPLGRTTSNGAKEPNPTDEDDGDDGDDGARNPEVPGPGRLALGCA